MLKLFKKLIYKLIFLIEKIQYKNLNLDQNDISKKILNSIDVNDFEIYTDTGYEDVSQIHKTQPFIIWKIKTSDGLFLECADNHIIFDKKFNEIFIKDLKINQSIKTINGNSKIVSIEKSKHILSMYDLSVNSKNHRYYTNGILSHNTICSAIFLSWYLTFSVDKNVMLMANKGATSKEIMNKTRTLFEGLPFFMKPGINKKDVMSMNFDNGCRIMGDTTTKRSAIGFTIHLLFLDEFAHVPPGIQEEFYENVYPTLSSSKISRVIITSTPNGYEKFHSLYQDAQDKVNEYFPFRVDWWQIPGRDEAWKKREIGNLGSIESFNQQYGNQFLSSESLLLSSDELKKLNKWEREFIFQEIDSLDDLGMDYSQLKWDPDFDIDSIDDTINLNHNDTGSDLDWMGSFEGPRKKSAFVFSVDLAEGIGKDYSIINIFRIVPTGAEHHKHLISPGSIFEFFGLEQVGIFRSNIHSVSDVAKILYELTTEVFDQEQVRLIIEFNTYGSELIKDLFALYPSRNNFDEETIVKYFHRADAKNKKLGIKLNKDNKKILCQQLKRTIFQNRLIIKEKETIQEAKAFSRNQNGTYSAQTGNDDSIMTCVNASSYFDTLDFAETVEEIFDWMPIEWKESVERDLEGNDINDNVDDLYNFDGDFI